MHFKNPTPNSPGTSFRRTVGLLTIAALMGASRGLSADEPPGLLFREDWKDSPPATPLTQEHVANPDLIVTRHGPAEALIKKSHHDKPADDPYYVWSGQTERNWAISLRHRTLLIDLTGPAKIRWRAKQTGFRQLRVILKLNDGTWLVSDQYDGDSTDWRVREFNVQDIRWRTLDIEKICEGQWSPNPDLSMVVEIGCTDLMVGGGTPASSRLDWIEVSAKAVPANPSGPAPRSSKK